MRDFEVVIVLASVAAVTFLVKWIQAAKRARRAEARLRALGTTLDGDAGMPEADSLGALAREVERLSEGQRFMEQLLRERPVANARPIE